MQVRTIKFSLALALALTLVASAASALAAYPEKPIRIIAPYAAGGAADLVARIISPKLSDVLKQSIIVENRAGAGGAIGSAYVATAPADGYTLLVNLGPPHQTVQFFNKSVTYDPVKDFTPIRLIATAPQALVVPSSSPIKTAEQFVQAARSNPKGLSYGTSGIGTSQHFAGLLLANSQKIPLTHIAYKGGAAALSDVVSGQTDAAILVLSNVLPYAASGQLRILGLVDSERSRASPNIPTLAEAGLKGSSVPPTWVGLLGPAKLSPAIVAKLSSAVSVVLKDKDVRAQLEKAGYDVKNESQEEFANVLASNTKIYADIAAQSNITPE